MGVIHTFGPVKHFVGALVTDREVIAPLRDRLRALYGTIDHESPVIPFDGNDRVFFSFERLIEADQLAGIKRQTNELEGQMSAVNLNPGYLENAKVVLASTKNVYQRIYLGQGIFAEVTMHFRNNTFQFFPWTAPDYQSKDYQEFFLRIRHIYRSQLKTMCILNREEPH